METSVKVQQDPKSVTVQSVKSGGERLPTQPEFLEQTSKDILDVFNELFEKPINKWYTEVISVGTRPVSITILVLVIVFIFYTIQ